jgi:hypothetical protein
MRRTSSVLTHVYHLFPNVAVSTFPTHRSMTVFEPIAIDRTRLISYQLSDRPNAEIEQTAVKKGRDFVTEGTNEDRDMQASVQRGLATRANEVLMFGYFEGGILRLHKHLAEALGEVRAPGDAQPTTLESQESGE